MLNMVDGALLLIDAVEGPMPQTRFVLRKALGLGLRVIVVINKVDRPHARLDQALNDTFDLFIELGATDWQAEFPVVYAIGLTGRSGYSADSVGDDLTALFETIVKSVPAPEIEVDQPARMLVTTLEYDNFKGQIAIGRLRSGTLRKGQPISRITPTGNKTMSKLNTCSHFHTLPSRRSTPARR